MSSFVLGVITFLLVIGPLILLHELGHYIALRLIGVTVLEFGIGFPPRALKLFERNGTEYTLNWLPIGGFVRPLGEDFVRPVGENATNEERAAFEKRQRERQALESRQIKTKSVYEAGPWQRIFFLIAGVGMNFLTGLVLFIIVALMGEPVLQSAKVTVSDVQASSAAAQAGLQNGDIITSVAGQAPKFAYDTEQLLCQQAAASGTIPVTASRGGRPVTLNLPAPALQSGGVIIQSVADGQPAAKAGLQAGDRILKLDDQTICFTDSLFAAETPRLGHQVNLSYVRNGQIQTTPITLNAQMPAIGASIKTQFFSPAYGLTLNDQNPVYITQPMGLVAAIQQGFSDTIGVVNTTLSVPAQLIRGQLTLQEARPASVVGISEMGAQVLQDSINTQQSYPLLRFAALISIAIGITQLLPIPGLDGGRILFVIIELIRGKPMAPEREGLVHLVGLFLLLGLMLIFVVNDVINPITLPH